MMSISPVPPPLPAVRPRRPPDRRPGAARVPPLRQARTRVARAAVSSGPATCARQATGTGTGAASSSGRSHPPALGGRRVGAPEEIEEAGVGVLRRPHVVVEQDELLHLVAVERLRRARRGAPGSLRAPGRRRRRRRAPAWVRSPARSRSCCTRASTPPAPPSRPGSGRRRGAPGPAARRSASPPGRSSPRRSAPGCTSPRIRTGTARAPGPPAASARQKRFAASGSYAACSGRPRRGSRSSISTGRVQMRTSTPEGAQPLHHLAVEVGHGAGRRAGASSRLAGARRHHQRGGPRSRSRSGRCARRRASGRW